MNINLQFNKIIQWNHFKDNNIKNNNRNNKSKMPFKSNK